MVWPTHKDDRQADTTNSSSLEVAPKQSRLRGLSGRQLLAADPCIDRIGLDGAQTQL